MSILLLTGCRVCCNAEIRKVAFGVAGILRRRARHPLANFRLCERGTFPAGRARRHSCKPKGADANESDSSDWVDILNRSFCLAVLGGVQLPAIANRSRRDAVSLTSDSLSET